MSETDLSALRVKIDALDEKLITLLQERMELVKEVGSYKKLNHIQPLDASRWQQVLDSKVKLATKLGLDVDMVKDIYNRIHEAALILEARAT